MRLKHWLESPQLEEGEPCRGCLEFLSVYRSGNLHISARKHAYNQEVRNTEAGGYCLQCFMLLPTCSVCKVNPTSHSEYPCIKCEMVQEEHVRKQSGGRYASPTYCGWSSGFHGVQADKGGSRRRGQYKRKAG